MATKKQKRAEALARRERYLRAEREIGLKALAQARKNREIEARKAWQDQHDKKHSWRHRVVECPLCKDLMRVAEKSVS